MRLTWLSVFGATLLATSQIDANGIDPAHSDLCLSSACTSEVDRIVSFADATINPCDDFYQFSCGTFKNSKSLYLSEIRMMDELREHLAKRSVNESKSVQLMRDMYAACSNRAQLTDLGTGPMMEKAQTFGGWPVLLGDSWDTDNTWTWIQSNKDFRAAGLPFTNIISVKVSHSRVDTKENPISIGGDFDGFARDTLKSALELAVALGAKNIDNAEREIIEALQFSAALRKINDNGKNNDQNLTINELQEKLPFLQWLEYINAMLPAEAPVNASSVITLKSPEDFDKIQALLLTTPKRTISNLLIFRALKVMAKYSTPEVKQIFATIELKESLSCTMDVIMENPLAMVLFYIKEVVEPKHSKKVTTEIVQNLRHAMSNSIKKSSWMDETTKQQVEKKLADLSYTVGYADEFPSEDEVLQLFAEIDVDKEKYLDSALRVKKFTTDLKMAQYQESYGKDSNTLTKYDMLWSGDIEFNQYPNGKPTFYIHIINMQIRNISAERPSYLNYGSIGMDIARKLIQYVDGYTMFFGPDDDWWSPETTRNYEERVNCINGQYNRFVEGKEVPSGNSELSLAEFAKNLSAHDIGGLKMAYETYILWASNNHEELALPNLDYTKDQLFFIAAGQAMCKGIIEESRPTDESSSNEQFRFMNAFANTQKFADAFQCPIGSRMNPEIKCNIW